MASVRSRHLVGEGPTEARASSGLEDQSCSPASLCPHVTRPSGHGHLQAGKHTLIAHCPCQCLHPGLPASRAVGTKYLLLNPQPAVICHRSLSRCRCPPSFAGAHRHAGEQDPTLLTPPPAQGKTGVATPADFREAGKVPVQLPHPAELQPPDPFPGAHTEQGGGDSLHGQAGSPASRAWRNKAGPGLSPDAQLSQSVMT